MDFDCFAGGGHGELSNMVGQRPVHLTKPAWFRRGMFGLFTHAPYRLRSAFYMSHVLKTRGVMKVSKGRSQPEVAADIRLLLYIVLGRPFVYRVLIDVDPDTRPIIRGVFLSKSGLNPH